MVGSSPAGQSFAGRGFGFTGHGVPTLAKRPGDSSLNREMAPYFGDSAPDTWGRRLMQRAERRLAQREGRPVRTLMETDYLLGVSDAARLGALRFRCAGEQEFRAPSTAGVPGLIDLGRLLQVTQRILRDEETDEEQHDSMFEPTRGQRLNI